MTAQNSSQKIRLIMILIAAIGLLTINHINNLPELNELSSNHYPTNFKTQPKNRDFKTDYDCNKEQKMQHSKIHDTCQLNSSEKEKTNNQYYQLNGKPMIIHSKQQNNFSAYA